MNSSAAIRYVCMDCKCLVDHQGQPGKPSQDRGGNRVNRVLCRSCGEKRGLK